MFDLISIGSISVDLYFKGKSLTFKENRFQLAVGGKYSSDNLYIKVGGGGANVAIGAAKFGLKPVILGTIGENEFKPFIIEKLRLSKVSYSLCDFVKGHYNLSAVLLTDQGERSIIHYATSKQKLFDHHISINHLANTRSIYLGNLPDVSLNEKIKILSFVKNKNIITVVNLGVVDARRPKNEIKKILDLSEVVIVNGHEFAEMVKAPYKDIHFHDNVIRWYIPFLSDQIVIVTEGPKGSYGYYKNQVYFQKAFKPKQVVDTTGAGDGYTAGFISEYLHSKNIEKSMAAGARYARQILEKIGAN